MSNASTKSAWRAGLIGSVSAHSFVTQTEVKSLCELCDFVPLR
jgi:hypothetical protein